MHRAARATSVALLVVALVGARPAAAMEPQVERGTAASADAWPDVVQVRFPDTWCTGTLVAPGWVLTAAHCGTGRVTVVGPRERHDDPTWVVAGTVVRHPDWEATGRTDLALVRLDVPHRYAGRPIRLATDDDARRWHPGEDIGFAGWGTTSESSHARALQEGAGQVVSPRACGASATELCVDGEASVCFGDSGGPMVSPSPTGAVLVGVTVRAQAGCDGRSTGTLVAPARRWIDATLAWSSGRLAGPDRFATAAAVAASWRRAPTVVVAGATAPFDALAAGPVAAALGAPVLLTGRDAVPAAAWEALRRLAPGRIVVAGGTGAVGDEVVARLGGLAPVERLAGPDRYATAAHLVRGGFPHGAPLVFVVGGTEAAEALTTAGVAAVARAPMLVVDLQAPLRKDVAAELDRLDPARIVLVAPGADPRLVADLARRGDVTAVDGPTPDDRLARLLDEFVPAATAVQVAGTSGIPDALAAAAAAAVQPAAPVVFARGDCIAGALLDRIGAAPLTLLGGTAAVPDAVARRRRC